MFQFRTAALILTALPLAAHAQDVERFSLHGNAVAVYNIAGHVTIERGSGSAVVVEVTRGGSDGRRLTLEQRTVDGRDALCVVYPNERIVYRQPGQHGSTSDTSDNDCRTSGGSRFNRHRIEVGSDGRGVEAWADLRVSIPVGRDVRVKHAVGLVEVTNVEATLALDVSSGSVKSRDTRGRLSIDAGSGGTTINGHDGNLTVDVGSGGIRANDIHADDLKMDTGSGSLELSGISALRARIQTGSGGARIGLTGNSRDVRIGTGSGSVTVSLPSSFSAKVDVSTGSGGIQSDFPVQRSGRMERHELHGTIGNGDGHLSIETGSGGVRLQRGNGGRGPI